MSVRIGTSGWSYPSGAGTWNGLFYPATRSLKAGTKHFDELRFYAEHFDTVEVNSTFYRPPTPDMARSWVERTPSSFDFSLKLYQKFTHPRMFKDAALLRTPNAQAPRPGLHADNETNSLLEALAQVTSSDIDEFRRGVDPLASAGKLGALLAQFPPSFKDSPTSRDHLATLLRAFADYPVAVELRHRSWSDAVGDTLAMLAAYGAAWTQIDEPKFRFSIRQNYLPNTETFYYMRLHGRNAAQWWRHQKSEDRYNYLYSNDELREFAEVSRSTQAIVKKSYLYTNNHFSAKSVVNAVMLKAQLGQPIEGVYPPELVERYPEIRDLVTTAPRAPRPVRLLS
jgi:uncharacterized protein YecE (DUF72 family)